MSVIILEGVCVSFKKSEVLLRNINLAVRRGESLIIIGSSGAGKSTFLKTLAGLIVPNSGRVQLESLGNSLPRIGMVFQKNALFDSLSVGQNLAFPLRESFSLNEVEIEERVSMALKDVDLDPARDLFPSEISGGMQKRLAIARALILKPEVILYDDPTAGLDPITSKIIVDLILRLKAKWGATIVVVTNDVKCVHKMGDRLALLLGGELFILGFSDPRVQQFLGGESGGLGDGPSN